MKFCYYMKRDNNRYLQPITKEYCEMNKTMNESILGIRPVHFLKNLK